MALDVEFGDAGVQALLRIRDREVVDRGRDFLDEEVQQCTRLMLPIGSSMFSEIALQRRDRAVAYVLLQFDGHRGP